MKALEYRLPKYLRLLLILIVILLIVMVIYNLFWSKNKRIAADYLLLATISPEELTYFQKEKPESWMDYTAVSTACKKDLSGSKAEVATPGTIPMILQSQLDNNVSLKAINWSQFDPQIKKSALKLQQLLRKYPIYTPQNYGFPLKKACYYIDTFGADREGGKRFHQGTDLFAEKGTPIYSVCNGIIEKIGWNRLGGERVGVRGDDGNYYYYAHLDQINRELAVNLRISTGDLIGTMGNTGDAISTPDHLHFGIELPNGEWLNPYPFLKVWEFHNLGISISS